MTQADQLLASLAVLRRQWRRRILLEAVAWVALAAVIGLVVAFAISRFMPVALSSVSSGARATSGSRSTSRSTHRS